MKVLALFLFPLGVHAALYASKERPASFRDADWSSVGMLPEAGADRKGLSVEETTVMIRLLAELRNRARGAEDPVPPKYQCKPHAIRREPAYACCIANMIRHT